MPVKIKPIDDKILVKRLDAEDKSKGGILLPDITKGRNRKGKVLAVGPGKLYMAEGPLQGQRAPMPCQKGDTVLFSLYSGNEVSDKIKDDDELLILRSDEVLAVVEE